MSVKELMLKMAGYEIQSSVEGWVIKEDKPVWFASSLEEVLNYPMWIFDE